MSGCQGLPRRLGELEHAFGELLADARAGLDEKTFQIFTAFLIDAVSREAARVANWERRHGGDAE